MSLAVLLTHEGIMPSSNSLSHEDGRRLHLRRDRGMLYLHSSFPSQLYVLMDIMIMHHSQGRISLVQQLMCEKSAQALALSCEHAWNDSEEYCGARDVRDLCCQFEHSETAVNVLCEITGLPPALIQWLTETGEDIHMDILQLDYLSTLLHVNQHCLQYVSDALH